MLPLNQVANDINMLIYNVLQCFFLWQFFLVLKTATILPQKF